MKRILFTAIGIVLLTSPLWAQETAGVSQSTSATIVKGKAPVAKDLLKVRFPKPKSFTLKNGLSVFILEDHRTPAVRFNLTMKAGSLFEPKPGVASETARMSTEGTTSRTSVQITDETENIGASVNANAGLDTATISASGLSESTDELIGLLSDVLLHPVYSQAAMDQSRRGGGGGFGGGGGGRGGGGAGSPAGMISQLQNHLFYGATKYGRSAPTRDETRAIKPEDLKSFHDAYYVPNGAILGVTGDVDARALRSKLEAALADWKPGTMAVDLPSADFQPKATAHIYLIDRPGSAQSVLQFASLGVKQTDPDFIALTVANRILGGGSSGRLFQNIRERKGYTYGAYSTLTANKWPGIWGANASVRTEVTEPAIGEFFFEFKRLQNEPVPADELALAKRSLLGGFARTLESTDGILQRSLELIQNNLPSNYWDTYADKIQAVTPEDVMRVARKYLGGGNIQLMVVGERKLIQTGMEKYGTVQLVDPTKITAVTQ